MTFVSSIYLRIVNMNNLDNVYAFMVDDRSQMKMEMKKVLKTIIIFNDNLYIIFFNNHVLISFNFSLLLKSVHLLYLNCSQLKV